MSERIAITGANSAVGLALLRLCHSRGVPYAACVRSQAAASQLPPSEGLGRVACVDYLDEATLADAFQDVRAVVHLPGLLIERRDSTYLEANVRPAVATVAAAQRAGVPKVVLVSAVGADPASHNRYYASKGQAEESVRASQVGWTILRAPLVLGAGTEGERALLRQIAKPRVRLLKGGQTRQQPLDVQDLARGVLNATRSSVADRRTLDFVGPESLTYAALVARSAQLDGRSIEIRSLPIPIGLLRGLLQVQHRLRRAGFSADALDVILDGHALDPKPAAEALGIELTPLDRTLRDMLRAGQDRA